MTDLAHLRTEIADRIADEVAAGALAQSFFYGGHERVNNLFDSATAAEVAAPGTYATIIKGPPAKAALLVATGVVADPFPKPLP